jgi:hypothetical protein
VIGPFARARFVLNYLSLLRAAKSLRTPRLRDHAQFQLQSAQSVAEQLSVSLPSRTK